MEFIYNGHSNDAGIYRLTNKLNGREYYGSAKRFKTRWQHHEISLKAGKAVNKFLQADFNKCGTDAFVFDVLEVTTGTKEERLAIEQTYIDKHHDGAVNCYNFMKKAKVTREGIPAKDPEQTRAKLRASSKAAWDRDNGDRAASVGAKLKEDWELARAEGRRQISDEARERMSASAIARWEAMSEEEKTSILPPVQRGKQSPEQVAKRVATMKARGHYRPLSAETKKKISDTKLAKRANIIPYSF